MKCTILCLFSLVFSFFFLLLSVANVSLEIPSKKAFKTVINILLLTLTVLVMTIDTLGQFLNWIITTQWEGDGGCRVVEVRAGATSPMPDHKGLSCGPCQT